MLGSCKHTGWLSDIASVHKSTMLLVAVLQ